MDQAELGEAIGGLKAQIAAVDTRLTEHIDSEAIDMKEIFTMLHKINDTLSQAKGAQRIAVWVIATLFAAAALAKGWIWPK